MRASIVPPPFGSGYYTPASLTSATMERFNCAAPFRERLLDLVKSCLDVHRASIVPPPFGSGYSHHHDARQSANIASIVPPPFGSGYYTPASLTSATMERFNCAAPFRERLLDLVKSCLDVHRASIVPPPFGSGYSHHHDARQSANIASIVPPPFGSGYPGMM